MRLHSKNKYHSNFLTSVFTYWFICLLNWKFSENLNRLVCIVESHWHYRRTKEQNRSVEKTIRERGWELPISHKWAGTWTKPSTYTERRYLVGCVCKKPFQLLSSCISLLWAVLLRVWISIWKCPLSVNERPNSAWKKAALNQHRLHTIHSSSCPITGLSLRCSCCSVVEHCVSSAKGCEFNSQGTHIQTK